MDKEYRIAVEVIEFKGTTETQSPHKTVYIRCDPEDVDVLSSFVYGEYPTGTLYPMMDKRTGKKHWGDGQHGNGTRSIPVLVGLPKYTRRKPEYRNAKTDFRKETYNVKPHLS